MNVADLQPYRLERRRQHAVERGIFEVPFAPHDGEALAATEHVDDLTTATDLKLVDRDAVDRRIPGKGDGAGREALRGLDE